MHSGQWFWIVYVVLVIAGLIGLGTMPATTPGGRWRWGGVYIVVMVLIGLLGWGIFGPPIK
jgi:hypothetical protein